MNCNINTMVEVENRLCGNF